jgi:phthalate 4,5-cis-dihydrodiol dehydrogenase
MSTPSTTVRLGIAGLGGAARQMIPAADKHPGVEIVAAADVNAEALARFAKGRDVQTFSTVEELCAKGGIDAIYVATPNQFHVEHALTAVKHRKHLLLEKPMALTLADSDIIIEAAEGAGLTVVVCSPHSFAPPTETVLKMLADGELGELKMIQTWYYGDWLYRPRTPEEMNPDPAFGGGVVFRQGPHMFDMLRTVAGGVGTSVNAMTGAWDPERPVPGAYTAFMRFENGVAATGVYSGYDRFHTGEYTYGHAEARDDARYARARRALAQAQAKGNELEMKRAGGVGGSSPVATFRAEAPASFSWISDLIFVVTGDRAEVRITPDGLVYYGQDHIRVIPLDTERTGRDGLVEQFYDGIVKGVRPTHDGRWAKATLEVCLAVTESGQSGREVALRHQRPLHG